MRGSGRPIVGAGGAAAGSAPPAEPATRTSTSRAWSTTQVMSPRVTSKRPRSSSAPIWRVRSTAPRNADSRSLVSAASSYRWATASVSMRSARRCSTPAPAPVIAATARATAASYAAAVGDAGARAGGHAELRGGTRRRAGRRDVAAAEAGRAATEGERGLQRVDDQAGHDPGRQRSEVDARRRRVLDHREPRPRAVDVEAHVAVAVGPGAGPVVAGEEPGDQPGSPRPRPTGGRAGSGGAASASRAAADRSCAGPRCRSSCAPAGAGWSPCRRRAPRRGARRTGRRPVTAAGSESSRSLTACGCGPSSGAWRGRRGRARRGRPLAR